MAEFIAVAPQTVASGQNVLLSDTRCCGGNRCISHRDGSGVVSVRGGNNPCKSRYRVTFGANVAIPTGGTVGPVSLALAVDGEPDLSTTMIVTVATVDAYFNVHTDTFVDVYCGDTARVAVENIGAEDILVQNASLSVVRVA